MNPDVTELPLAAFATVGLDEGRMRAWALIRSASLGADAHRSGGDRPAEKKRSPPGRGAAWRAGRDATPAQNGGSRLSLDPPCLSCRRVVESGLMPTAFLYVRVHAPAPLLLELAEFYGSHLGLRVAKPKAGGVAVEVGETMLELLPAAGWPFYHFALLAPGNRFEALLDWARDRVDLLPDRDTGDAVFDFTNWDAKACYFHDPAGNIVELIAHRGVGETGVTGAFMAGELLGVSEVGVVGDPPELTAALERDLELALWDGTVTGEGRLAFVGEKARTLILCRAGRPWLPTGRPAEAHPVEVVLSGRPEGEVPLDAGGWVRRSATRESG